MMKKSALFLPALAFLASVSAQAQTTVTSGYVQSVGAGTVTLNGGGLLAVNDTTFTVNNNIVLGTNGGLFRAYDSVAGGVFGIGAKGEGRLVINGSVSGSGGATIQDGGQIRFNGSNSYTGDTVFENTGAGNPSVYIGNVNAFSGSTVILTVFQPLNFSVAGTNTYNFGGLRGNQNLVLGANTLSVGANNQNISYNAALSGTGGFVKVGSGTQTLGGNNSFTGGTVVNDGTLALGSNDRLANSGAVTVNAGAFNLGGFSETVGAVTLAGGTITNGTLTGSSYDLRSGSISAALAGSAGITKSTEGTVILSGSNTYSGATTISAGTLQVGNGGNTGQLGSNTNAITNNGTLAFNRSDAVTFSNNVTGSGGFSQIGSGSTILTGSNSYTGRTTVSAGTLQLGSLGEKSLSIDNGAGNSTNLLINGGILKNNGSRIGDASGTTGSVTVESGTWNNSNRLRVGNGGTGSLNITGGTVSSLSSDIALNNDSVGNVTMSGGAWNSGSQFIVGGWSNAVGTVSISGGTLSNINGYLGYNSGSTGNVSVSGGSWNNTGSLNVGFSGNGSLSISGSGTVTVGDGSGTLLMGSRNTSTSILNLGNGGSSAGTLLAGSVSGGNGTSTVNVNSTGTTVLGQKFSVSSFNQIGSGTTILTGANYMGSTLISAGTLQVGNGGTNGTLGGVAVVNNAALAFNRANGINVNNQISGSGSLAQNGSGTLTLSGRAKTYTGGTVINSGTLETADNEMLADSGSVTVNSGGTFKVGQNETIASLNGAGTVSIAGFRYLRLSSGDFSGALNGGGDLYKTGTGVFNISGTSALTGALYLQNGTLVANSTTALNANNYVLMSAGSTFTANQNLVLGGIDQNGGTIDGSGVITAVSTITHSGAINGVLGDVVGYNSGLLKLGTGTTTLGAANTYTGTTKVHEGTLKLGANGSLATNSSAQVGYEGTLDLGSHNQTFADVWANTTVAGSGTMTVTGTLNGSGTIHADTVITGTHSPGNSPGIQTFGGNLTYQPGATMLWQLADNTTSNSPLAYDQVIAGGNLTFNGGTTLQLSFNDVGSLVNWTDVLWSTDQSWTIYQVSGLISGLENLSIASYSNLLDAYGNEFGTSLTGGSFSIAQNGQNVVLNYNAAPPAEAIPEPSTFALFGLGALALVIAYRRKSQQAGS
jgi:autotransporter-associated beta strand protein/T5SS/PEP-CTERM-associated repeat protein